MHSFTKFQFKNGQKSSTLSKSLIGYIWQSFHRIPKTRNSMGRSAAWLSYQGTDQVKMWLKRRAVWQHICNDTIYESRPPPCPHGFRAIQIVNVHFLQILVSKLGRMFKVFLPDSTIFSNSGDILGKTFHNAHQPNVCESPSPLGPPATFFGYSIFAL